MAQENDTHTDEYISTSDALIEMLYQPCFFYLIFMIISYPTILFALGIYGQGDHGYGLCTAAVFSNAYTYETSL